MQIQGIIAQASLNATMNMKVLDNVVQNVSNQNTIGYKTRRGDLYLTEEGGPLAFQGRVRFEQGSPQLTHRNLDVCIQGDGFFVVTQKDGKTAYTRDGQFSRNAEGLLVNAHNDVVGAGIELPIDYESLKIDEEGIVTARPDKESPYKMIGTLPVVRFQNPEGLTFVGQGKWVPSEMSGSPELIQPNSVHKGRIRQGFLERSNVNMFHQVDDILRLNAGVLSNIKMIRFMDEIFRQATNLRQ
jgi:flagellar basal-body rod protein FlgG